MANPDQIAVEHETAYYTTDMVRALNAAEPGPTRYECVYGELLVSPGPSGLHQMIVSRLVVALSTYVAELSLPLVVLAAPADISWGRDDVTVQPDVFVIDRTSAAALAAGSAWAVVTRLALAVEVVSPGSRRADRFRKRRVYQEQRVPLYWAIDPDARAAEVWTPDAHFPSPHVEQLRWQPDGAGRPLVMEIASLLALP